MNTFRQPETVEATVTIASRPELQTILKSTDTLDGAVLLRNQWGDMQSYEWEFESDAITIKQNRKIKLHATSSEIDAGEYDLVVRVESQDRTYVLPKDPEKIVIREGVS